jgi:hypothetical protein
MNDEAGKAAVRSWGKEFLERHGAVHDTTTMRRFQDLEQCSEDPYRFALSKLPFDLFATAVVHYTSSQIAQQKQREAEFIAGVKITRREYWNKLDRVHHYSAGVLTMIDRQRELAGAA